MKFKYSKLRMIAAAVASVCACSAMADSIPEGAAVARWRLGVELSPAFVPHTNRFLSGNNDAGKSVDASFGGAVRADFVFAPNSRYGKLYPDVYQGVGVDVTAFPGGMLGTPVSAYVYQGAPIVRLGSRLSLGYEWQFGAAFGWKHSEDGPDADNNAVSTAVTARMGVGVKLVYELAPRWQLSAGVDVLHFSNGNTSFPNAGVNTVGATVGVAYVLDASPRAGMADAAEIAQADAGRWFFDIVAYGAWRKRGVVLDEVAVLCPGSFGVGGVQFAPMRRFNRWFAAGASLDLQYDESAGMAPYYVSSSSYDDPKFYRPPFGKQISAGISAHAELTAPVFSVNAGIGYDFVCPEGDKRFYQSLTLKTFVTERVFVNVGYRLGNFKDPQNLMLGLGVRL